jgi:hypothetical protein
LPEGTPAPHAGSGRPPAAAAGKGSRARWLLIVLLAAIPVLALAFHLWPGAGGSSSPETVVIHSVPSGAAIVLDGKRRAKRTGEPLRLQPGTYRLRVELAEYEPVEEEIEVEAGGGRQTFRYVLKRRQRDSATGEAALPVIRITSTPARASVVIDGKSQSQTTPADFRLAEGPHRVVVTLAGRPSVAREVKVKAGKGKAVHHFELPERPARLLAFQGSRDPDRALGQALAGEVRGIAAALRDHDLDAVAVGDFTGPAHTPSSAGPLLARLLAELLQERGLTVKVPADAAVTGEYADYPSEQTRLLAVRVKGKVTTRDNKVLYQFECLAGGEAVVAALLGPTCALPLKENEKGRSAVLARLMRRPQVSIRGTQVATRADSTYAVEVLAAANADAPYRPRTPTDADTNHLAFVTLRDEEVYAVRLVNDSDHEAAVTLTIDGLNLFTFAAAEARGRPKARLLLVGPKSSTTVKGWFGVAGDEAPFVTGGYPRWGKLRLPSTFRVGTITATFAAAWPPQGKPPADEPNARPWRDRHCAAVRLDGQAVPRTFGLIRDVVSVRYAK